MNELLVGVDVGTSGARSALFDLSGNLLACEREQYPTYHPFAGWAEQDPDDWWHATRKGLKRLLERKTSSSQEILAIGVGGQTNGHVLVGTTGQSLGNAIIWQDRRATAEASEINKKLESIDMARFLGARLPIDATTIPARMLWLQRHDPDRVARAEVMLQPKDFINYRLTGQFSTDRASCKTIIDLKTNIFHDDYFTYLGLERRLIPRALPPHGIIGTVTKEAAKDTGFPAGTPVVAGCIDAWCNILGSGAVSSGIASDVAGTSEVVTIFSDYEIRTTRMNVIPSFDGYLLNGPTQSGGDSLKWFKDNFVTLREQAVTHVTHDDEYYLLNQLANDVKAGAGGLIFLPYLQGERAPIWDSNARGLFIGITKKHGYKDFLRAVFEGVTFSVCHVLKTSESEGGPSVTELRVSGSGAKSDLWNQLKADVTGKIVRIPKVLETGCLGAALIAGVGANCYTSYAAAGRSAVHISKEYQPMDSLHEKYKALYEIYIKIYPNLKDLFQQLAAISEVDSGNYS